MCFFRHSCVGCNLASFQETQSGQRLLAWHIHLLPQERIKRCCRHDDDTPQLVSSLKSCHALDHFAWPCRYAEAEPLCRAAVAILEQALGPRNPNVATALLLQVQCLFPWGDLVLNKCQLSTPVFLPSECVNTSPLPEGLERHLRRSVSLQTHSHQHHR